MSIESFIRPCSECLKPNEARMKWNQIYGGSHVRLKWRDKCGHVWVKVSHFNLWFLLLVLFVFIDRTAHALHLFAAHLKGFSFPPPRLLVSFCTFPHAASWIYWASKCVNYSIATSVLWKHSSTLQRALDSAKTMRIYEKIRRSNTSEWSS